MFIYKVDLEIIVCSNIFGKYLYVCNCFYCFILCVDNWLIFGFVVFLVEVNIEVEEDYYFLWRLE